MNEVKLFTILAISLLSNIVIAQPRHIDSLKALLQKNIDDSIRIKVLSTLANDIVEEDEWTKYNDLTLEMANRKLDDPTSNHKYYMGYKADATANVGYYYDDHGNISKALENYYAALKMYDDVGFEEGKAATLGNIGNILSDQQEYKAAEDYLKRSLVLKEKYAPEDLAVNYINLGAVMEGLKKQEEARSYYEKAIVAAKANSDLINLATANNNIGTIYYKKKQYNEALKYIHIALDCYKRGGDSSGEAWAMANLGENFFNLKIYDSAEYYNAD